MSKTNFKDYSRMPIVVKDKDNNWFKKHIKGLNLDFDKDFVVKINKENSDKIEKDIKENPSYNANFTKKIFQYYYELHSNTPKVGEKAKNPIMDIIRMIDLENSTNIWRYKEKRVFIVNMVNYIVDSKNDFWSRLANGEIKLVDDLRIASKANDESENETDGPKSLASKICKYFNELFFGKENNGDYYINDRVVRHVLPHYLAYYGIEAEASTRTYFDNISYANLFNYLEKIREKIQKENKNDKLTRSEIDHIMWYCYRYESID